MSTLFSRVIKEKKAKKISIFQAAANIDAEIKAEKAREELKRKESTNMKIQSLKKVFKNEPSTLEKAKAEAKRKGIKPIPLTPAEKERFNQIKSGKVNIQDIKSHEIVSLLKEEFNKTKPQEKFTTRFKGISHR